MTSSSNHKEESSGGESNTAQSEAKKHDSGAADLEKVTDYAEEKEIFSSSTDLEDAIAAIRKLNVYSGLCFLWPIYLIL